MATLLEVRTALVRLRGAEWGLFRSLGRSVRVVGAPEAKVVLATHARRHGEHWAALGRLLPAEASTGPEAVAASLGRPVDTAAGLAAVYDVTLPRLVDAYRDLRAGLDLVTAAPVHRTVEAILAAHVLQGAEGRRLLSKLGTKQELVVAASKHSEGGESPR